MIHNLDIDPIKGSDIMNIARISVDDLEIPQKFEKIKDIVGFFQDKQDYRYWLTKLTKGRDDNIDRLWQWVQVRKQRENKESEILSLKQSAETEDRLPPETKYAIEQSEHELKMLDEELSLYE